MTAENIHGLEFVNLMKNGCLLVPYNLPLVFGTYIKYTPEQITNFEEKANADFEKDDDTIMLSVPLFEDKDLPINPLRITYFPSIESDTLPTNRAIAEIGSVLEYWKNFATQMRTGEFRFFDFKTTSILPVMTDINGNHFALSEEKYKNHKLYNKTPYKNSVITVNYAGDSDLTGAFKPEKNIPFIDINGQYCDIPIDEVGLTQEIMNKIFSTFERVLSSQSAESTKYVKSSYLFLPPEIRTIIDEATSCESDLTSLKIWRTYILKNNHTDYTFLDDAMITIGRATDAEFAKNIDGSETLKAVDEFIVSLEEMYQEALPQYKR